MAPSDSFYLDVMCVLDMVQAAGGRPKTPSDLVSKAPIGRLAAGALQGTYVIDTSTHVLKVASHKLVQVAGFTQSEAVAAVQAFRQLVQRTGGHVATEATTTPLVPTVKKTVPWHMVSQPGARVSGIDHEDFVMLAGALACGSDWVLTRDNAVLGARGAFFTSQDLRLASPAELASRRAI